MKFEKYIDLNTKFQNSINLSLDINDKSKVNSYIPTTVGNDFLKSFLDNVLLKNKDKSTLVIAPYGKGKSHAILVLLNLLNKTDYRDFSTFLKNVKNIDTDLYDKIKLIQKDKYLPIIVSHTRGTLNQSLMNSLNKSLNDYGLKHIHLSTDYTQIIDRIIGWKESYPDTYCLFLKELEKRKIKELVFLDKISSYDENSYALFCQIHKEILAGVDFVPTVSYEVVEYYREVRDKIVNDFGYKGIYIVFDEFSKFLESRDKDSVSNDMKIIQDLAELCNSQDDNSMFFTMVLHKPISTYRTLDSEVKNAFKGIEGRVSSYYFHSSLKNSFELVFHAIKKNKNYDKVRLYNKELNDKLLKIISRIPAFSSEFDEDYIANSLIDNCYPLNPISLYLLIKINERVAQNERTLFTFLIKNSEKSFSNIIKNEYDYNYILPSCIFDYFKNAFLENYEDETIRRIALSTMNALSYADNNYEIELIKSLSLMLMINEKTFLPTSDEILSTSILVDKEQGKGIIDSLINKNVIIRRRDGRLEFKINMNADIQSEAKDLANTKFSKVRLAEELNQLNTHKYVFPRVYNTNNSITRFYKTEYIDEKVFLSITDLDMLLENNDGLILNIIRTQESNYESIEEHVHQINDPRLLVVYPNQSNNYLTLVKKIKAIELMISKKEFEEEGYKAELIQLLNDSNQELDDMLRKSYSIYEGKCRLINVFNQNNIANVARPLSRERILGDIFINVFPYSPIINLELINRHNVKATYKKARNELVNDLLKGYLNDRDCLETKTSPKDTIINCVLVETGLKPKNDEKRNHNNILVLINEITNFFNQPQGNFKELYDIILRPPYGVRKGIIPILISFVLSEMKDPIIINFKSSEVEVNADLLDRINDTPEFYSFKVDAKNNEKRIYLETLSKIFNYPLSQCEDYGIATTAIQKWYSQLPKFTKQMIGKDDMLNSTYLKKIKKYFSKSDVNASEFINGSIPLIFNSKNYDFLDRLDNLKNLLDSYTNYYSANLKSETLARLGFSNELSLYECGKIWIDNNKSYFESRVLSPSQNLFIQLFEQNNYDNEFAFINSIAYCLTGLYLEDWSESTINQYFNELENIMNLTKENNERKNEIIVKIDGKVVTKMFDDTLDDSTELIENIIIDAMDDFGDSISNEQKLALLVKIMKKYI